MQARTPRTAPWPPRQLHRGKPTLVHLPLCTWRICQRSCTDACAPPWRNSCPRRVADTIDRRHQLQRTWPLARVPRQALQHDVAHTAALKRAAVGAWVASLQRVAKWRLPRVCALAPRARVDLFALTEAKRRRIRDCLKYDDACTHNIFFFYVSIADAREYKSHIAAALPRSTVGSAVAVVSHAARGYAAHSWQTQRAATFPHATINRQRLRYLSLRCRPTRRCVHTHRETCLSSVTTACTARPYMQAGAVGTCMVPQAQRSRASADVRNVLYV